MSKNYFLPFIISLFPWEFSFAQNIVKCKSSSYATTQCNPYATKFIIGKEINYDLNRKKLIVLKTLPVPKPKTIKIISMEKMFRKHTYIEKLIRFDTPSEALISKIIDTKDIASTTTDIPVIKNKSSTAYGIYKVVSGDFLGKISNKFATTIEELLTLNSLEKNTILKIGQKFKIPLSQKMVDSISNAEYVIESGDTLLSIAHKFKIDPKLLVKFNNLKSSSLIRKGKTLILPLPYIVKKLEADKKIKLAKKKKELEKKKTPAKAKKKRLYINKYTIGKHRLRVTATAYSSHSRQTDSTPFLAAWNNRLRPGMKIIAVSRDLLKRYGLRNGTKVRIGGLRGYYRVRDKMNKRFRKRIDIYMGINRRRALRWGRRSVVIYW